MSEQRDAKEAAAHVFQARDITTHAQVTKAALDCDVSPAHAVAITKGMAQLRATLSPEQLQRAEEVFLGRAGSTTPRELSKLAPMVLAEVAPEQMPTAKQRMADVEAQARRAKAKRGGRSATATTATAPCGSAGRCRRWTRRR
ncbi:hypothetical protein BE11_02250 [Sorangium cellulosum]|nr:hypothetical protein BE11_02250 [Sorangium cellulosum]